MGLYKCVCIYVYMNVHMSADTCEHVCMWADIYEFVSVYMYACI